MVQTPGTDGPRMWVRKAMTSWGTGIEAKPLREADPKSSVACSDQSRGVICAITCVRWRCVSRRPSLAPPLPKVDEAHDRRILFLYFIPSSTYNSSDNALLLAKL